MPIAHVNEIDVRYEVQGKGPPFVWLHGLMGSIERSRLMGESIGALAGHGFRVIEYDARGHGQSTITENEADYTWASHANDMLALLDHLDVDRAIVGGGSMGAGVSIMLALEHPERVERLVLNVPPPLADTIEPAQQVFGGLAWLIEQVGVEQATETVLQLPQYTEMREKDPDQFDMMGKWLAGLHPKGAVVATRGLLFGPALPAERFAEITCPAVIIGQPDDQIHPLSTVDRLHAAIAGSQTVIAPSFGYYQKHPDELVEAIATFLTVGAATK
jgi:pimeloyl-ACP methyl ester carboxylesterase